MEDIYHSVFPCILLLLFRFIQSQSSRIDCDSESGWQCDYQPGFSHRNGDHAFCDLEVIQVTDNLEEFLEKCHFKKGCLINTTIEDWTNRTFWNKENMLSLLGDYKFDSGKSLGLVLRAGVGKLKYSLNKYIELNDANRNNYTLKEPNYIFDRSIWGTEQGKFRQNHIRRDNISFYDFAASQINEYNAAIFTIGNTGTGAAFHAHGENWFFLAAGRKRWFLYPPNLQPVGGFWPGYSSKDWFEFVYPNLHQSYDYNNYETFSDYNLTYERELRWYKPRSNIFHRNISGEIKKFQTRKDIFLTDYKHMNDAEMYGNALFKPLECIQSKGQILYISEFWWHAVLNLGDVIGAAVQTYSARTPWLTERDIYDEMRRGLVWKKKSDLEMDISRLEGIRAMHRLGQYGPMSAVHHFFLGFEFYDMRLFAKAIQHLTDALLMDPTFIQAYVYLSKVYSDATNDEFYNLERAEDVLRIGYMLNPKNDNIRNELLYVLRGLGKRNLIRLVKKFQPLPSKNDAGK